MMTPDQVNEVERTLPRGQTSSALNTRLLIATVRALRAELASIREVVKNAPHGVWCSTHPGVSGNDPCDCWKSKVGAA